MLNNNRNIWTIDTCAVSFASCFVAFIFSTFWFFCTFCCSSVAAESWDVQSDTWVATDMLGRSLPGFEETGPVKEDKIVAMFYFLWLGRHGEEGPFDVTKILAQDPDAMQKKDSPLWGGMYVPHHWGESIFGYYVGEDEYVLRKHAQMLGDAGVDVIVFDVTNQLTYPESYRPLCKVFNDVRASGNHAPQIAFLTPFWSPKKVVHELWNDLYSKGEYEDLWFKLDGKPFILADPALISESIESKRSDWNPSVRLKTTLGQSFKTDIPVFQVGAAVPTWKSKDSGATLTLYEGGPGGKRVQSTTFSKHPDNRWAMLVLDQPVSAGSYYLEMSDPQGTVGWWTGETPIENAGPAFEDGKEMEKQLAIRLVLGSEDVAKMLDFFTFRKPQPDYFVGPTGPNQWGWLEVFPQHGFYTIENDEQSDEQGNEKQVIEEVAVGIGQNAVDGKLGVLSNPRSHGRSFHAGSEPAPEQCDYTGQNFEEQWKRAYELDPKAVFITGWNEWIMGRFDETAPFHGVDVVSFVDQFNMEFSRDIEPIRFGHQDSYYYQLISHLRRFKGTRPVEKIEAQPIVLDGNYDDWKEVGPEFRDTIGDVVHRRERGWGKGTVYENKTGRNDIIRAKVSRDSENVYFYVQTAKPLKGQADGNWMMLFLDVDCDIKTGWLGYDFVLNRVSPVDPTNPTSSAQVKMFLEKNAVGNGYNWAEPIEIDARVGECEIELAIPRHFFGKEETFHFKWSDNIEQSGDWSDFTINGDSAPNDRYNYRAEF